MRVRFYSTGISYLHKNKRKYSLWVKKVLSLENVACNSLNVIFCSDDYLLKLNQDYLNHNTLTDIITFQYEDNPIQGEIYISIDRVKENAQDLKVDFINELNRVIIHGALHLCGHLDKTLGQKKKMRALETNYMKLLSI